MTILQLVREMHDLVVDGQLLAMITDNQHTNGAGAASESLLKTRPKVTLVDDLETLLDLTSLRHGNELAVIANVDETILLEDGTEERVENDTGRGVRDNARLLVKLLGEEINTEVTVLTGLSRSSDADDLTGTMLKDYQVTDADVVARDSESGGLGGVDRGDMTRRVRLVRGMRLVAVGDGHVVEFLGRVVVADVTTSVGVLVIVVSVRIVLGHFFGRG